MTTVSRAQRARLGIFLTIAGIILGGTLISLVGMRLLQSREEYIILVSGSVNGLESGSVVKYNGVAVGRVESVALDPKDLSLARVGVSVLAGTVIKEDTVATITMQGITGQKYVELSGGSKQAKQLAPGGQIISKGSTLDVLSGKAEQIADKIDALVENLVGITGSENTEQVGAILVEVRGIAQSVNELLKTTRTDIEQTVANANTMTAEAAALLSDARQAVNDVRGIVHDSVDPAQLRRIADRIESAVRSAELRLGKDELGELITNINRLVSRLDRVAETTDLALFRIKDDVIRVLDALLVGVEAFSDFAGVLRDNPAALLRGSQLEERTLP